MTIFLVWIVCAIAAAVIAGAKGRSGFGYFVLAALLPIIGLLIAIGMPSRLYVDGNGVQRRVMTEREFNRAHEPPLPLTDEEKWSRQVSNFAVVLFALAIPATFIVLGTLGYLPH